MDERLHELFPGLGALIFHNQAFWIRHYDTNTFVKKEDLTEAKKELVEYAGPDMPIHLVATPASTGRGWNMPYYAIDSRGRVDLGNSR